MPELILLSRAPPLDVGVGREGVPELILLSRAPPPLDVGVGREGVPELILLSRAPPPPLGVGVGREDSVD